MGTDRAPIGFPDLESQPGPGLGVCFIRDLALIAIPDLATIWTGLALIGARLKFLHGSSSLYPTVCVSVQKFW